jgi:hypothetical protein
MDNLLAYASENPLAAGICAFVVIVLAFAWMTR